jgi:uncharacterized membrane-anchored protein YitT (DUF2179 family)
MGRKKLIDYLGNVLFIQAGAFLAAFSLDRFLVPNRILDGGIVGISIIVSYLASIPLGVLTFAFNVPFMLLGLKLIGRRFLLFTVYAVGSLSIWVEALGEGRIITSDLFLDTVFGGILLGIGVGLILRNGGCLDGTEVVSLLLTRRIPFTVGEIVMGFNVLIFAAAGLVFGVERALYSAATYLLAYKAIDVVVEGLDESKALFIVSDKPEAISAYLFERLKAGVTIFKGMGGYSRVDKEIIYVIVRRLEISKIKEAVRDIDKDAFITVHNVHEVIGKNVSKRR